MKASFLIIAALMCSFQALARGPSLSEASFCADRKDENFVKDLTLSSQNLMAFANKGGIGNGGVCWWHSRFQRNALYLTIFKPRLPKPSKSEAQDLVAQIRAANNIVVIPGFNNFSEFSYAHMDLIQRELDKWQKGDGVIRFAWVKGLSGNSTVESSKMKSIMDDIYNEVEVKKNIAYNMLQIPGIDAHAWLVIHMEKVAGGYNLETLDSNFPSATQIYRYREGDVTFDYHNYFKFTPYLDKTGEMETIKKAILKTCDPDAYAEEKQKENEARRKSDPSYNG
jgi:hypothetical protein